MFLELMLDAAAKTINNPPAKLSSNQHLSPDEVARDQGHFRTPGLSSETSSPTSLSPLKAMSVTV